MDERSSVGGMGAARGKSDQAGETGRCHLGGACSSPIASGFAGKRVVVASSTAPLVALELDNVDPLHPDGRALIIGDAPGFAVHYWDGATLLSHFEIAGPRNIIASYNSNLQPMMKAFLEERGTG